MSRVPHRDPVVRSYSVTHPAGDVELPPRLAGTRSFTRNRACSPRWPIDRRGPCCPIGPCALAIAVWCVWSRGT